MKISKLFLWLLVLTLPAVCFEPPGYAGETRSNAVWVHGTIAEVEPLPGGGGGLGFDMYMRKYEKGTYVTAAGYRWFNFYLTTPVDIENTDNYLVGYALRFKTTKGTTVKKISLYDQGNLIAEFPVSLTGDHGQDYWQYLEKNRHKMQNGLNIMVEVDFGTDWNWNNIDWENAPESAIWSEVPYIHFMSAGAFFLRNWGGWHSKWDW